MRIYRQIWLIIVVHLLIGCKKETETALRVSVRDNMGQPIANAQTIYNGNIIGITDSSGILQTNISVYTESTLKFEVTKESDKYYFAPFFQTVQISDSIPDEVAVDAILYSVPKGEAELGNPQQEDSLFVEGQSSKTENVQNNIEASPQKDSVKENLIPDLEKQSSTALQSTILNEQQASPEVEETILEEIANTLPKVTKQEQKKLTEQMESDSLQEIVEFNESNMPFQPATVLIDGNMASIAYPKKAKDLASGQNIYTLLVTSRGKPVGGAEISWGSQETSDLKKVCETNQRGRCVIRYLDAPNQEKFIVVKKHGFQTRSMQTMLANKGLLRVNLEPGLTIDIYAVTRTYQFTKGLSLVDVSIDGKKVGVTDKFGHFSYFFNGQKDDLVEISLHSSNYLPQVFRTDFITSRDLTLVRHFAPNTPPQVRLTLLDVQYAGTWSNNQSKEKYEYLNQNLEGAVKNHFYSEKPFQEYPKTSFYKTVNDFGYKINDLKTSGWHNDDLKGKLDGLIVPTFVRSNDELMLELSVVGSNGKTMASATVQLADTYDKNTIFSAVSLLAKKLISVFPFEGAILNFSGKEAVINLGSIHELAMAQGEEVLIYGLDVSEQGSHQTFDVVARGRLKDIGETTSVLTIDNQKPRSIISRGDVVVLNRQMDNLILTKTDSKPLYEKLQVVNKKSSLPIVSANIYFDGQWFGSTDGRGELLIPRKKLIGKSVIKVIKHGFATYSEELIKNKLPNRISLSQSLAFLRVDSQPQSAEVYIDGVLAGRTPVATPIEIPSGFVKIELKGVPGYKIFHQILELDEGSLELVGDRAIKLESDYIAEAQRLVSQGKIEQALSIYEKVSEQHSDYLIAKHQAGEIYLTMMSEPAKAAKLFGELTQYPTVKNFQDKRFVGSHINEGLALFMTAERLPPDAKDLAKEHYLKAIEVFDRVEPFLRYIPSDQYELARQNIRFHRALSYHKLWSMLNDISSLEKAYEDWQLFLEESHDESFSQYREHAQVYLKQAHSILNTNAAKM